MYLKGSKDKKLSEFCKEYKGEKNHAWKGDKVKYRALHMWVERRRGKPSKCERCGTENSKRFDWSNKSGKYKRDLNDWIRLCRSCHIKEHFTEERKLKSRLEIKTRLRNNKGQLVKK